MTTRTEAQKVQTGQRFRGLKVVSIRKLLLLGKSTVILKCEGGIDFTLPAEHTVAVS